LGVEIKQGIGIVVGSSVGGSRAGCACSNVVGDGDASIDEGEGRRVDERSEERTVGGEDVQGDGDLGIGEEIRMDNRG
jgi:hypothetical protein